jgi:hypothetical protein
LRKLIRVFRFGSRDLFSRTGVSRYAHDENPFSLSDKIMMRQAMGTGRIAVGCLSLELILAFPLSALTSVGGYQDTGY